MNKEITSRRGFTPIIIIIVMISGLFLAGGGYVVYKDKQQMKKFEDGVRDLKNQPEDTSNDIQNSNSKNEIIIPQENNKVSPSFENKTSKDVAISTYPIVDFNKFVGISEFTVTPNTPITLSWNSIENNCKATEDWSGPLESTGQRTITSLKSRNFFTIQCNNFSETATVYVEPVPPTQPELSLITQKTLSLLIVFTNSGEPLSNVVKNDLCNSLGTNRFSYMSTWFKREASRYGVLLSMTIQCYDQQITLPPEAISTTDTYTQFGQSIPIPLNMAKTSDYLPKVISSFSNYDLVTVLHYRKDGDGVADLANIGQKINFMFLTKEKIIDGVQHYDPGLAGGILIKNTAHESLHSLGAKDHYDLSNPGHCLTESDPVLRFDSRRVMCAQPGNLESFVIPPETAKEIGWLK